MKPTLRVIIIEDNPDDAVLVLRELEQAGYAVQSQRVQTAEELRGALSQGTWDLVLADHSLPRFSATEGLAMVWETGLDVPFIIVSGSIAEETAVRLMKDGAADYIMKDRLSRLGPAVQRELHDAEERKRKREVERALAESDKRYRLLVENQTDLLVTSDPQGRLIYASPSYCNLVGRSLQELTTSSYQSLIHPDDVASVADVTASLSSPPYSCRSEARTMTVGGWRWIEWNSRAELDSKGTVVTLVGSGRDITDRKQMEDRLRESHERFQLANRATFNIIWDWNLQTDALWWNENLQTLFNYQAEEIEPTIESWTNRIHPEDLDRVKKSIHAAIDSGQHSWFDQYRFRRKDGSFAEIEDRGYISREVNGKPVRMIGAMQDITERKRAEQESQKEQAFFDRLVEAAPEGIAITDPQGRVMRVNAEFVRMFGYGADEAVGQDIDDLVAPAAHEEEARALTTSVAQRSEISLETARRKKNGISIDVSLIGAPILIEGKVEAVFAIYRDITKQKRAESQLRQSQKMEAIGELAGGVAHDFNNLLTGILGNIALMRSTLPSTDPLLENLDGLETAARQATMLTKGLLAFSRSAVVLPVPTNLTAALDTTLTLLKQSLPASMEIVRDYEQSAWNVLVDQSQITQILLNLAVNARDAMNGKGTLTIRRRNEVVEEEYVQAHPYARTGEFVHLSASDTGPGIPPAILEHLFEPFHTTKPVGSGTGLGLSIVYGAVKQAGGWITGVSTEGVGTTFDVYLPRCLEEATQPFTPSPLSVSVGSGTVLVIEDEPIVRAVAQALLGRNGYTVLTASDGALALDVLREHPSDIDLILLDMTMPGMTTEEVVQAIRALNPTVGILLTSGYALSDTVNQMVKESGVQGFLAKPYTLDELVGKVQELLRSKEGGCR